MTTIFIDDRSIDTFIFFLSFIHLLKAQAICYLKFLSPVMRVQSTYYPEQINEHPKLKHVFFLKYDQTSSLQYFAAASFYRVLSLLLFNSLLFISGLKRESTSEARHRYDKLCKKMMIVLFSLSTLGT